jgi:RNA polymerase sigma-70 factor (ECF subfamily)
VKVIKLSTYKSSKNFEEIYNETYEDILKYVILRCNNLDDVNEIVQDTYVAFYKYAQKENINEIKPFLYGIAKNKLKKYYNLKSKIRNIFVSKDEEIIIESNFNLEKYVLNNLRTEEIWQYLKKKNIIIAQIFYLYYFADMKIKEISDNLKITESSVKNHLYRSLKELNKSFGKGNDNE